VYFEIAFLNFLGLFLAYFLYVYNDLCLFGSVNLMLLLCSLKAKVNVNSVGLSKKTRDE